MSSAYADAGVDYARIDPLKILAQQAAATLPSLGPMPVDGSARWVRPGIDINDGSAVLEALDADRGIGAVR